MSSRPNIQDNPGFSMQPLLFQSWGVEPQKESSGTIEPDGKWMPIRPIDSILVLRWLS